MGKMELVNITAPVDSDSVISIIRQLQLVAGYAVNGTPKEVEVEHSAFNTQLTISTQEDNKVIVRIRQTLPDCGQRESIISFRADHIYNTANEEKVLNWKQKLFDQLGFRIRSTASRTRDPHLMVSNAI